MGGDRSELWRAIWNLDGPPKLLHFVWRASVGALATRDRLRERHVVDDGDCSQCPGVQETIVHAIFHCSIVNSIWQQSPFAHYISDIPTTSFFDVFVWVRAKLEKGGLLAFLALAWAAWSYHNSVTHADPWSNAVVGAAGFLKLVQDYASYTSKTQGTRAVQDVVSRDRWIPPREGWFRINSDAALLEDRVVGVGAVIRDTNGQVKRAAVRRHRARWSVALSEAMAAKFGLQEALRMGCSKVELECDAYNLSKAIKQQRVGRSPLDLIVEDIVLLSSNFADFSINHVKRGGNTVAHLLARVNPANGVEQVFVDDVPSGILHLAELDVG